jgi:RNA polymerase-binding transcription factor DksA
VEDQTSILQRELEGLRAQIASLEGDLEDKPDYALGEGDPSITRWEVDLALLKQLREQAANVERALLETTTGSYGKCEQCGRPIHPDRLAVLPSTKMCIRCARAVEKDQPA